MKKTAIFLILLLSIPGISGCSGSQNPASAVTAEEGTTSAENGGDTDEKNWSRQEILSMFENVKEDCWSVAGCVPISDDAYDRVGAVLFYDSETETSNTAFLMKREIIRCAGCLQKYTPSRILLITGMAS